jgi:hypothetical protein
MTTFNAENLLEAPISTVEIEDVAYMATAKIDGRTIVSFQMDPATAAVLWEIGKGILSGLGAKALASLFGTSGTPDIEGLFRKLLLDIADVVKASINEAEVRQATSEMQGLSDLMQQYSTAPETSQFRLQKCISDCPQLLRRLESLLPLSASGYILGVLTQLAAAQEYALITRSQAEKEVVSKLALTSLPNLRSSLESLSAINESRVSQLTVDAKVITRFEPSPLTDEKKGGIDGWSWYHADVTVRYYVDGVPRQFYKEEREWPQMQSAKAQIDSLVQSLSAQATSARVVDLDRIRIDFMSRVGISVAQSIQNIEKIAKMA